MKKFQSINPYNTELLNEFEIFNDKQINQSLTEAEKAFQHWKQSSFQQRSTLFLSLANILRKNKEKYALHISLEMGKILKESQAEIEKCALCCEYYAEHAEVFLRDEKHDLQNEESQTKNAFVAYEPVGAVFAVMPWNFPFWQVIRFAAPVLSAGNVGILKHAKNVTQCGLHLEEAFLEAGFPKYVFQFLIIESSQTEKIISHDIVQGVTLTGSEAAGSSVASVAGKYIKKSVLELGGADAFLILADADITSAAKLATQSRMQNAGQSCIAAKRFIVDVKVKNDFLSAFKTEVEKIVQGDQLKEETTMGPVSSLAAANEIEIQQNISIQRGAEIITGAKRERANYQATILSEVKEKMPAYHEEVFGPIASVVTAKNADDAIQIANTHRYGLAATIFSKDIEKATYYARKIHAGSVFINTMVKSDPRMPFGGIKKSGFGRELSYYGMKEFVNVKAIVSSE